jgi:fluoride exporter
MVNLLWVAGGGALGAVARYGVVRLADRWLGPHDFPWATLVVNAAGSFLLGFLLEGFLETRWGTPGLRLGLTTGFLGAFTTYSAFNAETLRLLGSDGPLLGLWYLAVTVVLCLFAGWAGLWIGRHGSPLG